MGNPPRARKRVHATQRAHDGSAFKKCENCGVSVAILLADMHECAGEAKPSLKRFKGVNDKKQSVAEQSFSDQPRSAFRFFMEDFKKSRKSWKPVEIDREGFETWKNMLMKEMRIYITEADMVNSNYTRNLIQEIDNHSEVDDEADSRVVGKYDLFQVNHEYYDSDSSYGDSFI